jgi:hypothetical protein
MNTTIDLLAELSAKQAEQTAEQQRLAAEKLATLAALDAEHKRRAPYYKKLSEHGQLRQDVAHVERLLATCKKVVEQHRETFRTHIKERREPGYVFSQVGNLTFAEKSASEIELHLIALRDDLAESEKQVVQMANGLNLSHTLADALTCSFGE